MQGLRIRNILVFIIVASVFSQVECQIVLKQHNTVGSELYADAPYRILKYNNSGNLNSLPVHFYIHHSNSGIYNNELAFIDIKIKNAEDSVFTQLLTYNSLSNIAFNALLLHGSQGDPVFGVQDFWDSRPQKSSQHTIVFTRDLNLWLPPVPYVDIELPYFYFTFNIPGNSLAGFNDVVDIEVTFGLDWNPDEYVYLRVNRSENSFPRVTNWYRGDVHFHGIFTQNDAENGLPLEASKYVAQQTGLDWITVTDHSCDFDNYGTSMQDNWNRLGQKIYELNNQDSSFILIRGLELSIKNSEDKTVHALIYPCDTAPYSLSYISDGGGDVSGTILHINDAVDSLVIYNAFAYAAHPFAEKDELPFTVNGGSWNLNDNLFPEDGMPHPSLGTVISNNISLPSDVFENSALSLLKKNICGVEIWNYWKTLNSDENPYNPWNVMYEPQAVTFSTVPLSEPSHHIYRLIQNMDIYSSILRRGLIEKNTNGNLADWKFFLSGGSDAHGDFNYSNTSFLSFAGINYDKVTDNSIGKINTLVYCPNGMGPYGTNILHALRNGHSVMSSGPVLTLSVYENGLPLAIVGEDKIFTCPSTTSVELQITTNDEFGYASNLALIVGTENGEQRLSLPVSQNTVSLSLDGIIDQLHIFSLCNNKWFYVRAELETHRYYSLFESQLFKKNQEFFHCFTNPVWLKGNLVTSIDKAGAETKKMSLYPNPATENVYIIHDNNTSITDIEVYSCLGNLLYKNSNTYIESTGLDIQTLKPGLYFVKVRTEKETEVLSLIKK
ncbi:MAG: hypothetical protein BWY70_01238 [Bacteroidetes bacterium ADurb.Bin408]|nr:MAG: hypothetical protein BWY70_01238 [Bacteroidetes bacterium ADurb.Bin408]